MQNICKNTEMSYSLVGVIHFRVSYCAAIAVKQVK